MLKHALLSRTVYLGIALAALMTSTATLAQQTEAAPSIQVMGSGTATLAPDMAIVALTVTRDADTARAALDANSMAMARVLRAMQENGVAEKDLETSNFSIQPKYHYPKRNSNADNNAPKIVGYTVRNSLSVRVRNLENVGSILDQSVSLGVNEGGNISFINHDPSAALTKARALAVKDAIAKANTLAHAANVKVGKIRQMSEHSASHQPMPMAKVRMAAEQYDHAVPVASGENSYQVSVSIAFDIEQ